MNAKKEKFENISSNFPHLENTATQIKSHEIINIPIPSTDTNKKIKIKKDSKKSVPRQNEQEKEKTIEEINKEKNSEKNKILRAHKRLDIQNLLNSDTFAEKYIYIPCKNEIMKLKYDSNYSMECPYSTMFYDNILLRDESIFFVHDKTQKGKFMDETDIEKIKTENIQINFGQDPSLLYYQILKRNTQYQNKIHELEKLQENLDNFSLFQCTMPNYININMDNFKENELVNMQPNYESNNSTRINSGASNKSNNIQLDGNQFLLNNEIYNEENNKDLKDNSEKRYINKKRKLNK